MLDIRQPSTTKIPNVLLVTVGSGTPDVICLKAEKKLLWKLDLFVIPGVALMYLFAFIDRANVGNARIAGMEKDLNFHGYDFNLVLTAFYIPYILFEIPTTALCKLLGPASFIPLTTLAFGLLSICTAFVHSLGSLCALRALMGIFEAGMVPGIAYYMSRWYKADELTFRLGLYMVMAPLAGAFGGLLASVILGIDSIGSVKGWRVLFVVEGIITCGLGLLGLFTTTDRPETARWLSPKEKELAVARMKTERLDGAEVLDAFDKRKLLRGIWNPVVLAVGGLFLLDNITIQSLVFFTPTIVKGMYPGHSTINIQLRTVPPYALGALSTLACAYLGWKVNRRIIFLVIVAPYIVIGYAMLLGVADDHVRYYATFFIGFGAFPHGSMTNAIVSANVNSDSARTAAMGFNMMMANIGGLVALWSYIERDAPAYHIGNGLNLAAGTVMFLGTGALCMWVRGDNRRREGWDVEEELAGVPEEEVRNMEWRHPRWRWKE